MDYRGVMLVARRHRRGEDLPRVMPNRRQQRWVSAVLGAFAAASIVVASACGDSASSSDPPDGAPAEAGAIDSSPAIDAPAPIDAGKDTADAEALPPQAGLVVWMDPTVNAMVHPNGVTTWTSRVSGSTIQSSSLAIVPNGLGTHTAVNSGGGSMAAVLTSTIAARPFTTLMVGRAVQPTDTGAMLVAGGGATFLLYKDATDALSVRTAHPTPFQLDSSVAGISSKARIIVVRRNGASLELRVDGESVTGTDPDGVQTISSERMSYGPGFAGGFLWGDVLLYDADLSAPTFAAAEGYLKTKYGL
jgi:hypothetical protein